MGRRPEITEQTKQAFMDALCLLMRDKPLDRITVQDVARRAGYNRCTFYQYFSGVGELLGAVEDDLLTFILERRKGAGTHGQTLVRDLVELYEERALAIDALFGEYGNGAFLERAKTLWLEQGVDCEVAPFLPPADDRVAPYLVEYRYYGSLSLFRLWLKRGRDLSPEEFMELVAELFPAEMPPAAEPKQA